MNIIGILIYIAMLGFMIYFYVLLVKVLRKFSKYLDIRIAKEESEVKDRTF